MLSAIRFSILTLRFAVEYVFEGKLHCLFGVGERFFERVALRKASVKIGKTYGVVAIFLLDEFCRIVHLRGIIDPNSKSKIFPDLKDGGL